MIAVPHSFREMPRWWGDTAGRAWLDRLPALVENQCSRWDLVVDGPILHGSNALVVPVTRNGMPAALRLCSPVDDLSAPAFALTHWNGRGVVRLLDADIDGGAFLLERLDYTRSLVNKPVLQAAEVLGDLTRTLAVPAPATVRSTRDVAAEASSTFAVQWQELGRPVSRLLLDAAVGEAEDLSQHPPGSLSVDGDLHFEQVLAGDRAPWIVVDPVLLRGDPEYDLGRVLWTRLDELASDRDIRDVFGTFIAAAGVPSDRARAWVIVRSMSYLLWGLQHGLTWDPPKCRRLLELFT